MKKKYPGLMSLPELMAFLGVCRQSATQFGERYGDARRINGRWFYDENKIRQAMGDKAGKPLREGVGIKLPAYYFMVLAAKKGAFCVDAKLLGPFVNSSDPGLAASIEKQFPAEGWNVIHIKRAKSEDFDMRREDIRDVFT